jgi:hypothetical protein
MNASHSWDEDLATGLVALAVAAAVMLAVTILVLLTDLCRVFLERAFTRTRTARILWVALVCLALALTISSILIASPPTLSVGIYLAAWSFLAFAVVVEGCDWYEGSSDLPAVDPDELSVSDVLSPWQPDAPQPPLSAGADRLSPTLSRT